jgi:hypothetical protein
LILAQSRKGAKKNAKKILGVFASFFAPLREKTSATQGRPAAITEAR